MVGLDWAGLVDGINLGFQRFDDLIDGSDDSRAPLVNGPCALLKEDEDGIEHA